MNTSTKKIENHTIHTYHPNFSKHKYYVINISRSPITQYKEIVSIYVANPIAASY